MQLSFYVKKVLDGLKKDFVMGAVYKIERFDVNNHPDKDFGARNFVDEIIVIRYWEN
jgi:hypothetical protein